jgi:hypothetical protein
MMSRRTGPERRQMVLAFYRERIEGTGAAPTLGEAGNHIGISAVAVHRHVRILVSEGKLVRNGREIDLPGRFDLTPIPTEALRAELGRRGVTMAALDAPSLRWDEGRPCAANHCQERVRRGMLMCRRHWFGLPAGMRSDIMNAWGARNMQAYQQAVEAARDHLGGFTRVVERVE